MSDDFNFEPILGLPEDLPLGEEILWQGNPNRFRLAWNSFGVMWISIYVFLAMLIHIYQGFLSSSSELLLPIIFFYFLIWLSTSGLMAFLANLQGKSSIYTITNKRVVMRIGVALPITFNIPFTQISSVDLKSYGRTGSLALSLSGSNKISYANCWPHVRPWHFSKPAPSLLFLENVEEISQILRSAMENELAFGRMSKKNLNLNENVENLMSQGNASVV